MKNAILLSGVLALAACPAGTQHTGPTPIGPETTATNPPAVEQPKAEPPPAVVSAPIPPPSARPQELTFPSEAFRAKQPQPAKPRPLQIPDIKTFKMANGITVYLVQSDKLPVVSLELNFDGGSMNDPDGKEGLASVCMDLMAEGTKKLGKVAFDEALADIASNVGSYAGRETQGVSMSTLKKHLDTTYALYVDTLLEPGFREAEFKRLIEQRLEGLKQAKGSPASIAGRINDRILYGAKHPFGKVTTEASYKALTLDDCVAYHATYVQPRGARMFVVGDIDEATLRSKFGKKALPQWTGKQPRAARLPKPAPMKGKLFFVQVDGATQSTISFMHFGPKRKAGDYFATMGAGRILGGGFSGRLNMNLREDKGYSYGARGGFSYTRDYGEFHASSSVRIDSTWQSVVEIYDEIAAMKDRKGGPTSAELERERSGAILSLPGDFATLSDIRGAYRNLVYHRLPLNYYKSYVQKLRQVKLGQVAKAAARHLSPDKAQVLVVGDGQAPQIKREENKDVPLMGADGAQVKLLDGITNLVETGKIGKGDVVFLDADGNVVTN